MCPSYSYGGKKKKEGSLVLPPRWEPMRPHAEQHRLWTSPARFKVVPAGRRSGKCLAAGTLITMADGSKKPVEEIKAGDLVLTVSPVYRTEAKPVQHIHTNGEQLTLRFITRNDRDLTCTPNHPILVGKSWVPAASIKTGDLLAVYRGDGPASGFLPINYKELAAHLLPNFHSRASVKFYDVWKDINRRKVKRLSMYQYNRFVDYLDDYFTYMAQGEVLWDNILEIREYRILLPTYDLTVEGNHNFFAGGILTHNTELAKRKVVMRCIAPRSRALPLPSDNKDPRYFLAAPTWNQAKRIYWSDLKAMVPDWALKSGDPRRAISNTDMSILFESGAQLFVVGLDKPERIEGSPWDGGVLDEYGNMKARAWPEHVRPALSDRRGWCDFIGVPEGRNHYYDLTQYAKRVSEEAKRLGVIPEWDYFHWPSADILDPEEIASAKEFLDDLTFSQEFLGCHNPDTEVRLWDGSSKKIKDVVVRDVLITFQNGEFLPTEVLWSGSTGTKDMLQVELEDGTVFKASSNHKVRIGTKSIELSNCSHLDLVPMLNRPSTPMEALAAIVGFNMGDGNIHKRNKGPKRRIGALSASFYSKNGEDLRDVTRDLALAGIKVGADARFAKPNRWRIQIGSSATKKLVEAGCPIGAKTSCDFGIPEWVKGGSKSIRKMFLAALFGAEGSTPRVNYRRKGVRGVTMSMHSKRLVFECSELLRQMGIKNSYYEKEKSSTLYILDNRKFFIDIGYLYARDKQTKAWLWLKYLDSALVIKREAKRLYHSGMSYANIGRKLGHNLSYVRRCLVLSDAKRVPNHHPPFEEWIDTRFKDGKLRLQIVDKKLDGKCDCLNVSVDSPDSSYVLSNGIDNFNSFIHFQGRAYYPFSDRIHCRPLIYNPTLPLVFCFDFNINPGIAVVCQEQMMPGVVETGYDKNTNREYSRPVIGTGVIGEVYIPRNSNTVAVCNKLIHDWHNHDGEIHIYGDATGGAGGSAQIEGSDWDIVRKIFQGKWKDKIYYFVPSANPKERVRVNAVNSRLMSISGVVRLMVDRERAPYMVKDFEGVRVLEGGSGEIDKKADPMLSHSSDAIGYYIAYRFPIEELRGTSFELLW